jgi:hypothetical protein
MELDQLACDMFHERAMIADEHHNECFATLEVA